MNGSSRSPIRVMHVIDSLYPAGAERLVADAVRYADRTVCDASVCCIVRGGSLADELVAEGFDVFVIGKRFHYDFTALLRLARLLRQRDIDLVHTHLFSGKTWGRLAAHLAGVRYIIAHEHVVEVKRLPYHMAIDRLLASRTDAIVAVSQDVKEYLAECHGAVAHKIHVTRNGVPIDDIRSRARPQGVIAELGIGGRYPRMAVVARLEEQKGHVFLLHAMAQVVRHYPRAVLLVVGEGSLRSRLEVEASVLGVAANVLFLGLRRDVPSILAAVDVFVMSSLWEGMSMAALEAMALERPVVATDVEGFREIVRHGHSGILVPAADPDALADALLTLVGDHGRRRAMGQCGYGIARDCFDFRRTVTEYERLYCEIVARKRRGGSGRWAT